MDYKAPVTMRIAVLTIGYADGVPRALSNSVGAVLIGKTETGNLEISACDWAEWTGGITNEVFSRLGERLGREVV